MVFILHGDDVTTSRKRLLEIQDSFEGEVKYLDGRSISSEVVDLNFGSQSLFSEDKLIVVENFLANKKDFGKLFTKYADASAVFWEGKAAGKTQLTLASKVFSDLKIEEFKVDPIVFRFLEAMRPGNCRQVMELWQKYMVREEAEVAMVMITRQVRLLMIASDSGRDKNEDWQKLSAWQKSRLSDQAKKFTTAKLFEMFQKLLEIDYRNKSGSSLSPLRCRLELWLLSL